MTAEELLKPRFKVIANYPCSMHKLGDVIETYESAMSYAVEIDDVSEKVCLLDYPQIFKKMHWWEERTVEQMPKRVKSLADDKGTVYEIESWDIEKLIGWIDIKSRSCCSILSWNPEYSYVPVD